MNHVSIALGLILALIVAGHGYWFLLSEFPLFCLFVISTIALIVVLVRVRKARKERIPGRLPQSISKQSSWTMPKEPKKEISLQSVSKPEQKEVSARSEKLEAQIQLIEPDVESKEKEKLGLDRIRDEYRWNEFSDSVARINNTRDCGLIKVTQMISELRELKRDVKYKITEHNNTGYLFRWTALADFHELIVDPKNPPVQLLGAPATKLLDYKTRCERVENLIKSNIARIKKKELFKLKLRPIHEKTILKKNELFSQKYDILMRRRRRLEKLFDNLLHAKETRNIKNKHKEWLKRTLSCQVTREDKACHIIESELEKLQVLRNEYWEAQYAIVQEKRSEWDALETATSQKVILKKDLHRWMTERKRRDPSSFMITYSD